MKGEHKPGYRAPRTGEKRKTRQSLRIDKLPEETRADIQKRRAAGETWDEISDATGLPRTTLQRWYDLRVEQVNAEVMAQAARAREFAAGFKEFKNLPEATANALASQAFDVMEKQGKEGFEKSLANLGLVISRLITAQANSERVKLMREKVTLDRQKFEQAKSSAEKATNEAAAKIGKGRTLTIDDINRLRERTFGLPPIEPGASSGSPA